MGRSNLMRFHVWMTAWPLRLREKTSVPPSEHSPSGIKSMFPSVTEQSGVPGCCCGPVEHRMEATCTQQSRGLIKGIRCFMAWLPLLGQGIQPIELQSLNKWCIVLTIQRSWSKGPGFRSQGVCRDSNHSLYCKLVWINVSDKWVWDMHLAREGKGEDLWTRRSQRF